MGWRERRKIQGRIVAGCFFCIVIAIMYSVIIDSSSAGLESAFDPQSADSNGGIRIITAPRDTGLTIAVGPATITLDSNAQLLIDDTLDSGQKEVTLRRGRLSAHVRSMGRNEFFAVRTFNAVAGVRGTIFSVAIFQNFRTLIEVQSGSVFAQGVSGERIVIEAGQKAAIEGMAEPEKVEALPKPPDIARMMEEMQAIPAPPPVQEDIKVAPPVPARSSDKTRRMDYGQLGYNPDNLAQTGSDRLNIPTTDVPTVSVDPIPIEPVNYSANP